MFKITIIALQIFLTATNVPSVVGNDGCPGTCFCESDKLFGIAEDADLEVAKKNAMADCLDNSSGCAGGDAGLTCICNKVENGSPLDCAVHQMFYCPMYDGNYRCAVVCNSREDGECRPTSDGVSDPHMNGFDGSKFNFAGLDKRHYVIFGRVGGDVLVSQLRKDCKNSHTYFNRFGLQTADSTNQIEVYLKEADCTADRKYCPAVSVNGFPMTRTVERNLAKKGILVQTWGNTVSISTTETTYKFQGRLLGDDRRYFNIKVNPGRAPSSSEQYLGVLGMTMNRLVGHEINEVFESRMSQVAVKRHNLDKEFNKALQSTFKVSGLFPTRDEALHSMHAISSMKENDQSVPAGVGSIKLVSDNH